MVDHAHNPDLVLEAARALVMYAATTTDPGSVAQASEDMTSGLDRTEKWELVAYLTAIAADFANRVATTEGRHTNELLDNWPD